MPFPGDTLYLCLFSSIALSGSRARRGYPVGGGMPGVIKTAVKPAAAVRDDAMAMESLFLHSLGRMPPSMGEGPAIAYRGSGYAASVARALLLPATNTHTRSPLKR